MHHRRPNGAWFSEADEYAVRPAQAGPPGREALERNAPNLLADYLYLWETTVVRQAIETATTSVSSGGHSSSYRCQQRQLVETSCFADAGIISTTSLRRYLNLNCA